MNSYGVLDTIWMHVALLIPGLHEHYHRVARRELDTNPTRFVTEFCERIDARIDLTGRNDIGEVYIDEAVTGMCEDLPGLLPYRASVKNFLMNKLERENGK